LLPWIASTGQIDQSGKARWGTDISRVQVQAPMEGRCPSRGGLTSLQETRRRCAEWSRIQAVERGLLDTL
jgi:hypothetical protein